MELWWQSLSTAEHVLLYVAVPATLILLLQTLLLFLGGDAPDLDGDGVPDALEAGADADLDGDGQCELIFREKQWEGGSQLAYSLADGQWTQVLRANYGM